jgi:acetyl esterase/lipase
MQNITNIILVYKKSCAVMGIALAAMKLDSLKHRMDFRDKKPGLLAIIFTVERLNCVPRHLALRHRVLPLLLTITLLFFFSLSLFAQPQEIHLYDGPAPGSENWKQEEKENRQNLWHTRIVYNVAKPTLTVLLPPPSVATGAGMVICPGGGFYALSIDNEGMEVARWLAAKGVACFVLKYRLMECHTDDPTTEVFPPGKTTDEAFAQVIKLATADGKAAIRYVRLHAGEFGVDTNRIGIIGFSAGGTVAACVGLRYEPESRPDFVAPIYLEYEATGKPPVPADAPPMFILAASDDSLGLASHSTSLYNDWTKAGKSAELHLLAKGGHGFGMRKQNLPSDHWIELFAVWLEGQRLLKRWPPTNTGLR